MMTSIRINNVAKPFPTRQAARDWANQNGGNVVDLSKKYDHFVDMQITCQDLSIPQSNLRWLVVFNRIICRSIPTKMLDQPFDHIGKTVVVTKKRYQAMLTIGKRFGRVL